MTHSQMKSIWWNSIIFTHHETIKLGTKFQHLICTVYQCTVTLPVNVGCLCQHVKGIISTDRWNIELKYIERTCMLWDWFYVYDSKIIRIQNRNVNLRHCTRYFKHRKAIKGMLRYQSSHFNLNWDDRSFELKHSKCTHYPCWVFSEATVRF